MSEEADPPYKRVKLTKDDLDRLSKDEMIERWQEQEAYVEALMSRQGGGGNSKISEDELLGLRESEEKLRQQHIELSRRENLLVMRLSAKEAEMQECLNTIQELKSAQNTSMAQLRAMLLDPAVNIMFQRMKKEMDASKEKLEQAQNDLTAWKFTPDSQTGKRLMAKCRLLLQENEELGKVTSSGRTAKLQGEIALQKKFVEEMKKSQAETDEFLVEMDEDVEGMQSTIYFLQQQLKDTKAELASLQHENCQLRAQTQGAAVLCEGPADTTQGVTTGASQSQTPSPMPQLMDSLPDENLRTTKPKAGNEADSSGGSVTSRPSDSSSRGLLDERTSRTEGMAVWGSESNKQQQQQQQQHKVQTTNGDHGSSAIAMEVDGGEFDGGQRQFVTDDIGSASSNNTDSSTGSEQQRTETPPGGGTTMHNSHPHLHHHHILPQSQQRTAVSSTEDRGYQAMDGTDVSNDEAWSPPVQSQSKSPVTFRSTPPPSDNILSSVDEGGAQGGNSRMVSSGGGAGSGPQSRTDTGKRDGLYGADLLQNGLVQSQQVATGAGNDGDT